MAEAPVKATGMDVGNFATEELTNAKLQELIKKIHPDLQIDDDVSEVLKGIIDDFVERLAHSSCMIAKHRNADMLETEDVRLCLERQFKMVIPGFAGGEPRQKEMQRPTENHLKRMALKKKATKRLR